MSIKGQMDRIRSITSSPPYDLSGSRFDHGDTVVVTGIDIAVVNQALVAVGESGLEVEVKARKIEPHKIPSVLRVPREEDMACLL